MSELTAKFGLHSTQICQWKKQLLQEGMEIFMEEAKGKKISNHRLLRIDYQTKTFVFLWMAEVGLTRNLRENYFYGETQIITKELSGRL